MLGVFAARDLLLFYVFFEFTLVPLFFLIGIWGHEERRKAAVTSMPRSSFLGWRTSWVLADNSPEPRWMGHRRLGLEHDWLIY